jgi:alpha-1,2-mannosyltransferase
MASGSLAPRMRAIASSRGWGWPVFSGVVAVIGVTTLALAHEQIDLSTYLLGGAHARASNLFTVTLPIDHLGFTYPPFSALLFAPFAHSPLRVAEVTFSWVNLAGVLALMMVSLRAVCASLDRRTILWWALVLLVPVLLFDPVRQTFLLGQVNIILALMVVADMCLELPIPRGILVGLAAAIKLTPIILIPYLLLTKQVRAALWATGAFCGAALVALAVAPSNSWAYWTHYIRDPQRAGMLSWIGNQGLLGAIERALGHTVTTPTTFVIAISAASVGLAVGALAYRRSSAVLGFLVVEATESLANPVSWSHHFIWVVLLVAWLALGVDRPRYGEWWALAAAVLFWAAPSWWVPHGPGVTFAGRGWLIPVSDTYVLLFIVLVVGAGVRVCRRRAPAERPAMGSNRRRAMAASGASA